MNAGDPVATDRTLAVCAAVALSQITMKAKLHKHFAKLLTARTSPRKDMVRPQRAPITGVESVLRTGLHGNSVSLSPKFALTLSARVPMFSGGKPCSLSAT